MSATLVLLMVAERWCYKAIMRALLMVSASVAMSVHLWTTPMEALYSEFKETARKRIAQGNSVRMVWLRTTSLKRSM